MWEEFGEAMEKDFHSTPKKFWQIVRRLRRGKQNPVHTVFSAGGELLTSMESIVGRWKEYFEDLLNPTTHSEEETKPEDFGLNFPITGAEVARAVKQLCSGSTPGVDEIRPELLKALEVVGLSWLTRLVIGDCAFGVAGACGSTTGGPHSSASPGRSTPGYWRGERGC